MDKNKLELIQEAVAILEVALDCESNEIIDALLDKAIINEEESGVIKNASWEEWSYYAEKAAKYAK